MISKRIAIVDVGMGNIRSVVRALEQSAQARNMTVDITVTNASDVIFAADSIVFPGQGAYGDCSRALHQQGSALYEVIRSCITAGKSYLGICLGLQALFAESEEAPGCPGLAVYSGAVRKLTSGGQSAFKLPHIGWNLTKRNVDHTRTGSVLAPSEWYYYVHSYAAVPDDQTLIAAVATHGNEFCAAVQRDNVLAVQFHPEKSQRAGLQLLGDWLQEKRT